MKNKIEGYWSDGPNSKYPMPVAGVLTDTEARDMYELIKAKEQEAINDNFMNRSSYRGMSGSRIDGSMVGCAEFEYDGWIWPDGFAGHYVLIHQVKPSDEFIEFLKK